MLQNTLYQLKKEKKLHIGYFGGSITDGTGSSDMQTKSYRALVTDWFRKSYSDADITETNAAIGGTGTGYGMFRCERDLLTSNPDLVFVEFAANDWGDSYDNVLPRAESIFRKIRRSSPYTDIIAVFTTYEEIAEDLERGIEYESRSAIAAAAHRYNASIVDPGAALYANILKNGAVFTDFIPDTLHPNDTGHRIMADCITKILNIWFQEENDAVLSKKEWEIPSPICENSYDDARMIECSKLENLTLSGFELVSAQSDENRFDKYLEAKNAGDSFSFTFSGRCVGICWGNANINGNVVVRIDDDEPINVVSWDNYVRSFHKMQSAIVNGSLDPDKTHKVTITASEFSPTEISPESVVRIGAIFMA